jgi:lipopolysaccharide/colanic/teichoic acid biosynthesis glycosyltransferase
MAWRNPRSALVVCAAFDLIGLLILVAIMFAFQVQSKVFQSGWIVLMATAYLASGWLFGTYTLLRWPRLPLPVVVRRVLLSGFATLLVVAVARWCLNPPLSVWIVHRSTQLPLLMALMGWSLLVRGCLRRGMLLAPTPRWFLSGPESEATMVLAAWRSTPAPVRRDLVWLPLESIEEQSGPLVLALTPALQSDRHQERRLEQLAQRDPREFSVVPALSLIEQQLERLPPQLLPEPWLSYGELPWNRMFSLERQLKRGADLLVAGVLLLASSPLLLLAAACIWLEDRGPVIYRQRRSGWLGRPFEVWKLRTMQVAAVDATPVWTKRGDQRITRVGGVLRRLRLDELPQLLQVLTGEMSLIGPRPERPEFEQELEQQIPHYRKRHWMRPGLSGWAQVCAPYAASVEDSAMKLSYDLYYLKHFSTWLDLLILFRTIKTVLKAGGR